MAITAVNINATREYVSKSDKDQNSPTKWHLGFLDSLIMAQIDDQITVFEADAKDPQANAKTTLKVNQSKIELVRFGLKGIDNFIDHTTKKPVVFETESVTRNGKAYTVVSESLLKKIPRSILYELADEIKNQNEFSESEEKN